MPKYSGGKGLRPFRVNQRCYPYIKIRKNRFFARLKTTQKKTRPISWIKSFFIAQIQLSSHVFYYSKNADSFLVLKFATFKLSKIDRRAKFALRTTWKSFYESLFKTKRLRIFFRHKFFRIQKGALTHHKKWCRAFLLTQKLKISLSEPY